MLARYMQRGDTIIEVLLAVTVFSIVAVGVITIMNQGANAAQRALEITLVRQQIDTQAEALRAAHQSYTRMVREAEREDSVWSELKNTSQGSIVTDSTCPNSGQLSESFVMNPKNATISTVRSIMDSSAPLYSRVLEEGSGVVGYGLWIERTQRPAFRSGIPVAHDFRIRACWFGPGRTVPMELETIVRLYDVDN